MVSERERQATGDVSYRLSYRLPLLSPRPSFVFFSSFGALPPLPGTNLYCLVNMTGVSE